jgi:hypothetical protein
MGYTTNFDGQFNITPTLSPAHIERLSNFADERHEEGDFPGYYCQWIPTNDGTAIEFDGNEKFYYYEEWIVYLIKTFLAPWGYLLNGQVMWQGEEVGDVGVITIKNNSVHVKPLRGAGKVIYDASVTFEGAKELPAPRVFLLGPATETE